MGDPRASNPRKSRGGLWLLTGLVLGAVGAIFLPDLASPYLPAALRGERVEVHGVVDAKEVSGDRLLLTVSGPDGATLVTYRGDVAEIGLLVNVGDSVTIGLDEYAPFASDAPILRVRKQAAAASAEPSPALPADDTLPLPEEEGVDEIEGDDTAELMNEQPAAP